MVSRTPFGDVLADDVYANLDDDLQDGYLHGLDTASYDESVLLWGPPGAGKTTESVARLAAYVNENPVEPRDVTIVTYRSELAETIRGRVEGWGLFPFAADDASDPESDDPFEFMATGHAVAARASGFLDRFNDDDEDMSEYAGMVDETAERAFCEEHGIQYKTGVNGVDSQWDVFSDLYRYGKQNLLDVGSWGYVREGELLGTVRGDSVAFRKLQAFHAKWGDSASFERAVEEWEAWKREHDCHDYYEQLEAGLAVPLPATDYVIIDELHDAYPLMTRLFEKWIDAADVAVVAGDPDQVCNAFSGSHPAIFEGLNGRVETELPTVQLPKSHRVPDEHFAAAARILSRHRTPPELETAGEGALYRHVAAGTMTHDERDGWMPLHPDDPASPLRLYEEYGTDIMFEARTQTLVDGIGACLDAGGVVYRSQTGAAGNWERRLDVLNALRKVEGVRTAKQTGINKTESFGREDGAGRAVTPGAAADQLTTAQARVIVQHTDERHLTESRRDVLEQIALKEVENTYTVPLDWLEMHVESTWWSVYGQGVESVENLVYLTDGHGFTGKRRRDVIAMKRAWHRYDGAFPVLDDVKTRVWTIHAAKGDEAEHAAVYTGVTGRVRDGVRGDEEQAANESRTWYVGLTRASEGLHIVRDAFRMTCDDFRVLPGDLERKAAEAACERRRGGGGSGVVGDAD